MIMPHLERKNSEAFARNLPEPVVGFSACIFAGFRAYERREQGI